jgi:hypothetical protein
MPKFIVGGLDEKEILNAYVFPPKSDTPLGTQQVRLRKGTAVIDVATFGVDLGTKGPNGESAEVTPGF